MAKILVTDDSKAMRTILMAILVKLGHEIIGEAKNGLEAFDKYRELKPDIVTMDITMPVLNGVESLKKIKEFDSEAKVIMVTSNACKNNLAKAFTLGACDYILKPITEDKMKDIKDLLDRIK